MNSENTLDTVDAVALDAALDIIIQQWASENEVTDFTEFTESEMAHVYASMAEMMFGATAVGSGEITVEDLSTLVDTEVSLV